MKKTVFFISLLIFANYNIFATETCFLAKENNKVIKQEGDCTTRYSPASTFKVPLSLMGYDSKIFVSESNPKWPVSKQYYDGFLQVCNASHNPREWMRDSCVWYSRVLTQKLGLEKIKDYLAKFDYGNQDFSGDAGKNNGLTDAWISSSLRISPIEQAIFVQKILDNNLSVSKKAYTMTKKILFKEELSGGWKLYGKTGNAKQATNLQQGWFIGWIEKNNRKIVFVNHLVDDKQQDVFASFRARDDAKNRLWQIIEDLEKGSK